jgi:hypothetical protein
VHGLAAETCSLDNVLTGIFVVLWIAVASAATYRPLSTSEQIRDLLSQLSFSAEGVWEMKYRKLGIQDSS